jgi:O-antigen/teichoic acid export membrane protein
MPLSPRNLFKLKDEFALTVATGLALLIQFIFQSVIVRSVSAESYGLISSLLAIQGVLNIPIAIWQLGQTRSLASFSGSAGEFRSFAIGQLWRIRHIILATVVLYLLIGPLVRVYIQETSLHIWLLVVIGCLLSVVESWGLACFQSLHAFVWLGLVSVGAAVARLIGILLLIPQMGSVSAALTAVLAGYLVPIVVFAIFLNRPRTPSLPSDASFLRLSLVPASLSTAFTIMWLNLDFMIARNRFEPAVAGEYATVAVLCKAIFWFSTPITTIYLPRFVKALATDPTLTEPLLRRALVLCVIASLSAIAVGWLLGGWLVSIFAGRHDDAGMDSWFRLLLIAKLPVVCVMPFLAYFVAKDSKRALVTLLALLGMTFLYAQTLANDVHSLLVILFVGGTLMLGFSAWAARKMGSRNDLVFDFERQN